MQILDQTLRLALQLVVKTDQEQRDPDGREAVESFGASRGKDNPTHSTSCSILLFGDECETSDQTLFFLTSTHIEIQAAPPTCLQNE